MGGALQRLAAAPQPQRGREQWGEGPKNQRRQRRNVLPVSQKGGYAKNRNGKITNTDPAYKR